MTSSSVPIPLDQSTHRQRVRAVAVLALVVAFGGDGFRNAFGLVPSFVIAALTAVMVAIVLVRARPPLRLGSIPPSLIAYLGFALASIVWSAYPGASALTLTGTLLCTLVGVYLAVLLSWSEILVVLSRSISWILGTSLAFELWVSLVIRHPVFPAGFSGDPETATPMSMWSRNLLFSGDRIQGILGNSNLLGIIALLGVIVFSIRLAQEGKRPGLWVQFGLSVALFLMTRSSTVVIAAAVIAVVLAFALWVRAAARHEARVKRTLLGAGSLVAATIAGLALWPQVLALFGKSSDLTGRVSIWETVITQAEQHPIVGNGYASPWVPWAAPFDSLVVRNDVLQLQAHNAWLDVWMQLGVIGLIAFGALVLGASWRSWFRAVDQPRTGADSALPFTPLSLLPLLLITALLVQSVMESRILVESGWVLLVMIAVKTAAVSTIVPDRQPVSTTAAHS